MLNNKFKTLFISLLSLTTLSSSHADDSKLPTNIVQTISKSYKDKANKDSDKHTIKDIINSKNSTEIEEYKVKEKVLKKKAILQEKLQQLQASKDRLDTCIDILSNYYKHIVNEYDKAFSAYNIALASYIDKCNKFKENYIKKSEQLNFLIAYYKELEFKENTIEHYEMLKRFHKVLVSMSNTMQLERKMLDDEQETLVATREAIIASQIQLDLQYGIIEFTKQCFYNQSMKIISEILNTENELQNIKILV